MTPPARTQAAVDALDLILAAVRDRGAAADEVLRRFFAARRYMGSGDRRAVRALVFDVVRAAGEPPPTGRAAVIGYARVRAPELLDHFGTGGHAPSARGADEPEAALSLVPAWLEGQLHGAFGTPWRDEAAALLERAPVDVRVNIIRASRDEVSAELGGVPTPRSPWGLRLPPDAPVDQSAAFAEGRIEVQDEASQLAALACGAAPGMIVIDLCAGAGGKTLGLAAAMANRGRIVACDTDRSRLSRLAPRAARAGVTIAETRLLSPPREVVGLADLEATADVVLVDAPCSGSGTWRRNPEARWRLTPDRLAAAARLQDRVLALAAPLVRPGGRLVYAVCSVLPAEGAERAAAFLAREATFTPAPLAGPLGPATQARLTPHGAGTDGFFVAAFARAC